MNNLSVSMDLLPSEVPEGVYQKDLSLSILVENEFLLGPNPDADFTRSVSKMGILCPILVIQSSPHYHIAAGRRRVKAARTLGHTTIPAIVFPEGTGAEILTLIENTERSQNAASELAAIETLIRERQATEHDIAMATGMDLQTIRKREKLTLLIPMVRELLNHGRIRVDDAERIAKLSSQEQEKYLEACDGKIGAKTLTDFLRVKRDGVVASLPASMFEDMEVPMRSSTPEGHRFAESINLTGYPSAVVGVDTAEGKDTTTYQLVSGDGEILSESTEEPVRVARFPLSYLPYLEFLIQKFPEKTELQLVGESLQWNAEAKGYSQIEKNKRT